MGWVLLLTLVLMLALPGTESQSQEPTWQPSVLGDFLTRIENASVRKKEVGVLIGSNKDSATFTAIVAWDPANRAAKVSGIEVRLEQGDRKGAVYIDDDKEESPRGSLEEFQQLLTQLARRKDEFIRRCREGEQTACNEPGITAPGYVTAGAMNRDAFAQHEYDKRVTVFSAGWYGGAKGVLLNCPGCDVEVRFEGVGLDEVVKAIAAGRAFLNAN